MDNELNKCYSSLTAIIRDYNRQTDNTLGLETFDQCTFNSHKNLYFVPIEGISTISFGELISFVRSRGFPNADIEIDTHTHYADSHVFAIPMNSINDFDDLDESKDKTLRKPCFCCCVKLALVLFLLISSVAFGASMINTDGSINSFESFSNDPSDFGLDSSFETQNSPKSQSISLAFFGKLYDLYYDASVKPKSGSFKEDVRASQDRETTESLRYARTHASESGTDANDKEEKNTAAQKRKKRVKLDINNIHSSSEL